jgi:flagellar protein FlaG
MEPIGATNSQKPISGDLRKGKSDLRQPSAPVTTTETVAIDPAKIESFAQNLDDHLEKSEHNLKISVDKQTGKTIVKVVSKEDGKTIRQIPSEDLIKLVSRLDEMIGVMFDEKT